MVAFQEEPDCHFLSQRGRRQGTLCARDNYLCAFKGPRQSRWPYQISGKGWVADVPCSCRWATTTTLTTITPPQRRGRGEADALTDFRSVISTTTIFVHAADGFGAGSCGKRAAFSSREAEGGGFPVGRGAEPRCQSGNPRPSRGRRRGGLGGIRPLWIPLRSVSWPSPPRPGNSVP